MIRRAWNTSKIRFTMCPVEFQRKQDALATFAGTVLRNDLSQGRHDRTLPQTYIQTILFLTLTSTMRMIQIYKSQINQFIQTSTCSYSDYTFYIYILLQLVTYCYILWQLVTSCYIVLHFDTSSYILLQLVTYCYILLHLVTSCYNCGMVVNILKTILWWCSLVLINVFFLVCWM